MQESGWAAFFSSSMNSGNPEFRATVPRFVKSLQVFRPGMEAAPNTPQESSSRPAKMAPELDGVETSSQTICGLPPRFTSLSRDLENPANPHRAWFVADNRRSALLSDLEAPRRSMDTLISGRDAPASASSSPLQLSLPLTTRIPGKEIPSYAREQRALVSSRWQRGPAANFFPFRCDSGRNCSAVMAPIGRNTQYRNGRTSYEGTTLHPLQLSRRMMFVASFPGRIERGGGGLKGSALTGSLSPAFPAPSLTSLPLFPLFFFFLFCDLNFWTLDGHPPNFCFVGISCPCMSRVAEKFCFVLRLLGPCLING